jgi:hypothetical protein
MATERFTVERKQVHDDLSPCLGASTVQFSGENFLSVDLRQGQEAGEEVTEAMDLSLRFRSQEKSGKKSTLPKSGL